METKTRHDADCKKAFGRFDKECARCRELIAGAPARKGWNSRAADDVRRGTEIDAHFQGARHLSGGCGIVCTFGEW
jgi:hypothetical protein